jgi:prepilin-type N-terminal cleavage/methylation domain-containing protein
MKAAMKRGFTIVELLVVITIIGILMAMLFQP